MWVFPTDYTDKWSADSTDVVFASDTSTNFNITVDEIWTEVFTDRTTDNLSEWTTNKYASTTNVNAAWATMNTDTSLTWNGWFLDEDTLVSDDATKVPSQQSVKAYVDNYIVPSATETTEWIVERATDAETVTWTDTTRYVSAKQLADRIGSDEIVASDTLTASADTEDTTIVGSYTKFKEIQIWNYRWGWTIRVKFDIACVNDDPAGTFTVTMYGRIYVNGSAVWTERTVVDSETYVTYSEDISVSAWDLVQFYGYRTTTTWDSWKYRNFRIYYDEVTALKAPTVNLDT